MNQSKMDLLQGTLDLLILKTLTWGPQHGFGISGQLRQTSRELFQVEQGSLYPALQRLEQKGWITADWGVSDHNRKAKFYRLTPAGRKQLAQETSQWQRLSEVINAILGRTKAVED